MAQPAPQHPREDLGRQPAWPGLVAASAIGTTERLTDAGVDPSVGTVGDLYDNALAESVIGLLKAEVIKQRGPWKNLQAVEWESMHRVDWYNTQRLPGAIGYLTPAEAEQHYVDKPNPLDLVA